MLLTLDVPISMARTSSNLNAGTGNPLGIAVDPIGRKVCWANDFVDLVSRTNLDGSGYEELTTESGLEGFGLAFAPGVEPPAFLRPFLGGRGLILAMEKRPRSTGFAWRYVQIRALVGAHERPSPDLRGVFVGKIGCIS